jgi:hypothetical protein
MEKALLFPPFPKNCEVNTNIFLLLSSYQHSVQMAQTGVNLPGVQILETDIFFTNLSVETLVTTTAGRGQQQANSNNNKNIFSPIFHIQILSF